ncbi:MAG: hypothetical protein HZB13_07950 [Acidobacteria bacterium]|nr:hypothetical protein [Acidobacteriota bacterium]
MEQVAQPKARLELIQRLMEAGLSQFAAEEWVARELGESKGDCVAVDKDGREWSMRELEEQGKLRKAG